MLWRRCSSPTSSSFLIEAGSHVASLVLISGQYSTTVLLQEYRYSFLVE